MQPLVNSRLRLVVAALVLAAVVCVLLVGLPRPLLLSDRPVRVTALLATEARSAAMQPRLVDMRSAADYDRQGLAAIRVSWPPSRRPPKVAVPLWQEYLALYSFLGNVSRQTGGSRTVSAAIEEVSDCPHLSPDLAGSTHMISLDVVLPDLEELDFFVRPGGGYRPNHCRAKTNVAIIIPFRNRWEHLAAWLLHMHPFLQKQALRYAVFVVNQEPGSKFNRGMLLNVGFKEANRGDSFYDCYIFHDVDLLPENDYNIYDCHDAPRHMSSAVDKFNYRLPYQWLIGGVVALTKEQFIKVNGYSNLFFGWGGEDDDFSERLLTKGYQVSRHKPSVARYKMLKHELDAGNEVNPQRYRLLQRSHDRLEFDGLSSLQYSAVERKLCKLFTWISVHINQTEVYAWHEGVI